MSEKLDFLFAAEMADGSVYYQDPYDKSKFGKGSAYGDIKNQKIKTFSLVGKGQVFTINLVDGHAEINGTKIYPPQFVWPGANFELIYYMEVQQQLQSTQEVQPTGLSKILQFIETEKRVLKPVRRYFLGWQYMWKGKNHQWVMGVN